MYINLSKNEFVRTILNYKKDKRLELRINSNLVKYINLVSSLKASKFITIAIIEKLYREGGRIYGEDNSLNFTVHGSKPYIKCKKKCFYRDNW